MDMLKMIFILSVSGSALAVFLMLLTRLFGKELPSAFAYYAWLIVLFRFLLPIPGQLSFSFLSDQVNVQSASVSAAEEADAGSSFTIARPRAGMPVITLPELAERDIIVRPHSVNNPGTATVLLPGIDSDSASIASMGEKHSSVPGVSLIRSLLRNSHFWVSVWAGGMLVSAVFTFWDCYRFRKLLQRTLKAPTDNDIAVLRRLQPSRTPALYRSRAAATPMLLGLLRPMIILPDRDHPNEMLESILLHELTHYRRGDLFYKWFTLLALLPHWFNPLTILFRQEIDRVCELSCDAVVLSRMNPEERKNYGELLLTMAASRPLPGGVGAASFATEKRNLKERLLQIMRYQKYGRTSLALALALLLLLTGCGMAVGPKTQTAVVTSAGPAPLAASIPESHSAETVTPIGNAAEMPLPAAILPDTVIDVSTVDEFLNAIGPDRVIRLADGVYNLTQASTYGQSVNNEYWYWEDGYDGFQLRLFGVRNLHIRGSSAETCSIVTEPRYANVLSFSGCEELELRGLNIGHTPGQGYCSGGVVNLESCSGVAIVACDLYGCGTLGISASNCRNVVASNTVIRDCTYGAVEAYSSRDIRFVDGKILNCGISKDPAWGDGWTGFNLIRADTCTFVAVVNSEIRGNVVQTLFASSSTLGFYVLGCEITGNTIGAQYEGIDDAGRAFSSSMGAVFDVTGKELVLSHSSFKENELKSLFFNEAESFYGEHYSSNPVVDFFGNPLDQAAIEGMSHGTFPLDRFLSLIPADPAGVSPAQTDIPDGTFTEVHVTTADEFLAAISNYTVIHVDTELMDFSTASNYGGYGGDYYYWVDNFDGPGLVITGVTGLHIMGQGKDLTTLQATPRYSEVLFFDSCRDISISDLTAGHRKEAPGSCSGDVLEFLYCSQVIISNCGLFGCGVNGIVAEQCSDFNTNNTEIYDCSWTGAQLYTCENFNFENCSVHDCYSNTINLADSRRILWDETELHNGENEV